jgi:hypothetical protein
VFCPQQNALKSVVVPQLKVSPILIFENFPLNVLLTATGIFVLIPLPSPKNIPVPKQNANPSSDKTQV